jgi:single-strand DNA-binding protein
MASVNKAILLGNLTRDVELKNLPTGSPVAEFGVAMNEKYKDKETVVFIDVTVWGSLAENCAKYISKGSLVFIEGKLTMDSWEDKTTGKKRTKLKVTALNVQFLNSIEQGKALMAEGVFKDTSDIPF